MKSGRGAAIGIGLCFGFIFFTITVFLVPPQLALLCGVFTALVFIFALSLIMDLNLKKYKNIDDSIDGAILLKCVSNYYSNKLIASGILFLTADRIIFISHDKKPFFREEILLNDIKRASYGIIWRHIHGLKLIMNNSAVKGFMLKDYESFLEGINKVINPDTF